MTQADVLEKAVCFNCGIPGHVAWFCTNQQHGGGSVSLSSLHPSVCTLCMHSFYTSMTMTMMTCWNCGMTGHYGVQCMG